MLKSHDGHLACCKICEMHACGKGHASHLCYGSVNQLELADCEVHLIMSDAESYFLVHVLALVRCM